MDIIMIGKKISEARKTAGLTQMELADTMMVSYQAVSNWERGLTMPDITKLPKLSQTLGISIDVLLGTVANNPIVKHAFSETTENIQISIKDIEEVGPIINTKQVDDVLSSLGGIYSFEEIISIAPFTSEETLHTMIDSAWNDAPLHPNDAIIILSNLAPFIDTQTIDEILSKIQFSVESDIDWDVLSGLVPFLSEQALDVLAEYFLKSAQIARLSSIVQFLNAKSINKYAYLVKELYGFHAFQSFIPFVDFDEMDFNTDV